MTTYTTDTINHILSTSLLTAKYTQEDVDLLNQADILLQDRLNQARNAPGTEYHTPGWFAAEFNAVATNSVWDPQRALDLVMMITEIDSNAWVAVSTGRVTILPELLNLPRGNKDKFGMSYSACTSRILITDPAQMSVSETSSMYMQTLYMQTLYMQTLQALAYLTAYQIVTRQVAR